MTTGVQTLLRVGRWLVFDVVEETRDRTGEFIGSMNRLVTGLIEDTFELVVLNTVDLAFDVVKNAVNKGFDVVLAALTTLLGEPVQDPEDDGDA